ncbi:uncharacterized protein METZ01_LOCUS255868 [marine metagenome]|uniref:Uncharacterized protein n=1 Tax=marine metagenome TaxID=408172 RepID=A0A382IT31_9ZZZZ
MFGQDTLNLKSGESFTGASFGKVGENIVFKVEGETSTKKFSINDVEIIKIKSGELSYPFDFPNIKSDLALEEYQKLSTKEKAIYDAKSKNLVKWALYGPTSIIIFMGSTFLHKDLMGGEFWDSPIFLAGSSAASLTISYFVLNRKEKFNFPKSILTDSEKEIYKQTYSKKIRERKTRLILGSVAVTGILGSLMFMNAMSELDLDFGSDSGTYTGW